MAAEIAAGGIYDIWRGISGSAVLGSCGKGGQETMLQDGKAAPGSMNDWHEDRQVAFVAMAVI